MANQDPGEVPLIGRGETQDGLRVVKAHLLRDLLQRAANELRAGPRMGYKEAVEPAQA